MVVKKHSQTKRAAARRAKITKRFVDAVELPGPEAKYGVMYWDTELVGFALRVYPTSRKVYLVDYYDKRRRQHRINLGPHGVLTPDKARELAKDVLSDVRHGEDPVEERQAARNAETFGALAERYIAVRCPDKRSGPEDARIIRRELLPAWCRKPANEITRSDVIKLAEEIKKRGAPVMANRTVALVKRLYNWAQDRDAVNVNPGGRVRPLTKEAPRERVLSNEEIQNFWHSLERLSAKPGTRAALKLVLTTAQRPGECAGIAWEEIDFQQGLWTIPPEKSKNGKAHRVPLSGLALEIISDLPHREAGPVFPSPVDPKTPISRAALARALYRGRKMLRADYTPHDLRRSAASRLASMGVSRTVIGRILNHSDRGVTGTVYDKHSYDSEKRAALDAWGEKLRGIIEDRETKVIPLAR